MHHLLIVALLAQWALLSVAQSCINTIAGSPNTDLHGGDHGSDNHVCVSRASSIAAAPVIAYVEQFEADGKHIFWMHGRGGVHAGALLLCRLRVSSSSSS